LGWLAVLTCWVNSHPLTESFPIQDPFTLLSLTARLLGSFSVNNHHDTLFPDFQLHFVGDYQENGGAVCQSSLI